MISDTHGLVRSELHTLLDGVDWILHAGDVGPQAVLDKLSLIAPVTAVLGNTDPFDHPARLPERTGLEIAGVRIEILHGHQVGRPTPTRLSPLFAGTETDLVLFGHTHEPLSERLGSCHFLNPGSCGPRRFGLPVSAALVRIDLPAEAVYDSGDEVPGIPLTLERARIEFLEFPPA